VCPYLATYAFSEEVLVYFKRCVVNKCIAGDWVAIKALDICVVRPLSKCYSVGLSYINAFLLHIGGPSPNI
jgi:hypothetical protein